MLCFDVEIFDSCNGLILFDFECMMCYSFSNSLNREHLLIPYLNVRRSELGKNFLVFDYPNADQYKLVTISNLVENSNWLFKFHLLSIGWSGLWRDIQLTTKSFIHYLMIVHLFIGMIIDIFSETMLVF